MEQNETKKPSDDTAQDSKTEPGTGGDEHTSLEGAEGQTGSENPAGAPSDPAGDTQREILYLKAEFDNFRKRTLREQDNAIKFANERVFGELLTIVDLFDRAVASTKALQPKLENNPAQGDVKNFILGVEMTHRELIHLLGRFGVELTGAMDEKFDPARHEAILEKETTSEQAGKVIEVLQRGCLLHGRTIKPARVVVGKFSDA